MSQGEPLRRAARTRTRLLLIAVLCAASAAALSACATPGPASPGGGPKVTFRNDADVPVSIRYWVGRLDIRAPGGVADIRTDKRYAFTADPGQTVTVDVGRATWSTAHADAVIRARAQVGAAEEALPPQWFELTRPHPYSWRAVGGLAVITFQRVGVESGAPGAARGGGRLVELPRELWIESERFGFPADAPVDPPAAPAP